VKNPAVIIVKKPRRGGHAGSHGGAWKVAYADFVTAMMAFFLVMWLVAQSQGVRQAVAGYFKDPGIFDFQKGNAPIAGGGVPFDPQPVPRLKDSPEGVTIVVKDQETLSKTAGRLKDMLGQMPEFRKLGKQVDIQLTAEGLRIELLESGESTFFDSGSPAPKPETERILAAVATELGKLDNHIVLEGHTDSLPYSRSRGYTNWELSADRANSARRVMEQHGLRGDQVQGVRGYADTRLRVKDAPFDSRNRRVSIIVQSFEAEQALSAILGAAAPEADIQPSSARPGGR
jgi:chemotaxis protein MotB